MKKNKVKLSVVLGTYNRLKLLKRCLRSLIGTIKSEHEIIVIDAGSNDGTLQFLNKNKSRLKIIADNKRIGQAKSLNKVIKNVQSDYLCWLSDDNQLIKGMLDEAVSIMESDKKIGMVGLKVKDVAGQLKFEPYIGGISAAGILNVNQGLIRTKLIKDLGGFDENYPDYGMDIDLTTMVLLAGYKVVYTREVAIRHFRDQLNFPGAFQKSEREKRHLLSVSIYLKKYRFLSQEYKKLRRGLFYKMMYILDLFFGFYFYIGQKIGLPMVKIFGFNGRDIHNILTARFISKMDLWYNRKNRYYLVQYIKKNSS